MAQSNGNGYYTQVATDERPLGELFQQLAEDARSMVNLEFVLARNELSEKASVARKGVATLAAGAMIVYAGFLALIAAAIFALATALPAWLAALVVGVAVALIGYFIVRAGLNNLQGSKLMPNQTISTLKADTDWVKDPTQGMSTKSGGA